MPDDNLGEGEMQAQGGLTGLQGPLPEIGDPPASMPIQTRSAAPASILFLTQADTDLLTLRRAAAELPAEFPVALAISLRGIADDHEMEELLATRGNGVRVIVCRVFGSVDTLPGFRALTAHVAKQGLALIVLSATPELDAKATSVSTVASSVVHEAAAYFRAGGPRNVGQCIRFLSDHLLMTGVGYERPLPLPDHGIYRPGVISVIGIEDWLSTRNPLQPTVGIVFYRSHWASSNLEFIDTMIARIEQSGANALAVFTTSLKYESQNRPADLPDNAWPAAFDFLLDPSDRRPLIDVLITTTSLSLCTTDNHAARGDSPSPFERLGVPVLQALTVSVPREEWEGSSRGLNPLDTAMYVALPEFDGRLITVPVSFKRRTRAEQLANDDVRYVSEPERAGRIAALAMRYAQLKRRPIREKKVAIILTNSPTKAGRIGNAVGLDAPASLINILHALRNAGYIIDRIPDSGDALIHQIIDLCSYDRELLTDDQLSRAAGHVPATVYESWFAELPAKVRQQMAAQWGPPPGNAYVQNGAIALAGLDLGNVFVALQPPRGYELDAQAIYHNPDIPPPHNYYALYRWLREIWKADAIIHLGKHGTLEWLPGKGIGLSAECYPDVLLADIPFFYPFIMNDPGEGSQAKRRGHATVVDHLVPPMTTADAYGPLSELIRLVDEYYQVELLDPSKLPLVQRQILDLIKTSHIDDDLRLVMRSPGVNDVNAGVKSDSSGESDVSHLLQELDAYLCELTSAQIRDGLHILGEAPAGEQLLGLLHAISRVPNLGCPSLVASVADLFGLNLDALKADKGQRLVEAPSELTQVADRPVITNSDALEVIEELAKHLLALLERGRFAESAVRSALGQTFQNWDALSRRQPEAASSVNAILNFVCSRLHPAIQRTTDEIDRLVVALNGGFVPAGPSGAPTRGMAHALPSGRNFYSVDPRAVPSDLAWQVGQALADEVVERHRRETGEYPETVGISAWGTSAMRTHGDDVAQIFALMGVRPRWQPENRRVTGVDLIPLPELGRPRVDVVVRISGFFRDAFPHLIGLLDEAVELVAHQDETSDQNYVRKHYLQEVESARATGESAEDADRRARYRVFGAKPGSYGAGILQLIDERNWTDHADMAEVYINWGGYAYTATEQGLDARDIFRDRLRTVQVALHNRDNREHDILDSDDYLQFHGGMIATIHALTGRKPRHYFGDTHDPSRPEVRDLKAEVARVFRTRVANPKWLESIRRHGYKGGLELNATVDYLFGFDATSDVVDDWMYQQVAEAYVFDPAMKEFLDRSNPWARHAIVERLLEAEERGLWTEIDPATFDALRNSLLETETALEARTESTPERVHRVN